VARSSCESSSYNYSFKRWQKGVSSYAELAIDRDRRLLRGRSRLHDQKKQERDNYDGDSANNEEYVIAWSSLRRDEIIRNDRPLNSSEMPKNVNEGDDDGN
jgi:hypothetical protein